MNVEITERTKIRRASASIRNGVLCIQIPKRWPQQTKDSAISELIRKIEKSNQKRAAILSSTRAEEEPRQTILNNEALQQYVFKINQATFQVPLGKVRIGHSKYTQLAQLNTRTKVMSVSTYCLTNVPASALRYLIIHELAHYLEANHSKRFWAHVERHVPDYRFQSKLIKAFHQEAVIRAESTASSETTTNNDITDSSPKTRHSLPINTQHNPHRNPARRKRKSPSETNKETKGLLEQLNKQLSLFLKKI